MLDAFKFNPFIKDSKWNHAKTEVLLRSLDVVLFSRKYTYYIYYLTCSRYKESHFDRNTILLIYDLLWTSFSISIYQSIWIFKVFMNQWSMLCFCSNFHFRKSTFWTFFFYATLCCLEKIYHVYISFLFWYKIKFASRKSVCT